MNKNNLAPTYYVRHPDDSYSVAAPQPSIPAQQQASTAQEQAASVPVDLWSLIDAYADQKATYVYSQFTKSQRENVEFAKAELSKALNSIATPVAPAHALTDAEIEAVVTPLFQNRACQKHDYIVARAIAAHLARKG